jgi:hypothetical protein
MGSMWEDRPSDIFQSAPSFDPRTPYIDINAAWPISPIPHMYVRTGLYKGEILDLTS